MMKYSRTRVLFFLVLLVMSILALRNWQSEKTPSPRSRIIQPMEVNDSTPTLSSTQAATQVPAVEGPEACTWWYNDNVLVVEAINLQPGDYQIYINEISYWEPITIIPSDDPNYSVSIVDRTDNTWVDSVHWINASKMFLEESGLYKFNTGRYLDFRPNIVQVYSTTLGGAMTCTMKT